MLCDCTVLLCDDASIAINIISLNRFANTHFCLPSEKSPEIQNSNSFISLFNKSSQKYPKNSENQQQQHSILHSQCANMYTHLRVCERKIQQKYRRDEEIILSDKEDG